MERTIPDDHLVALIILSYVDMGTHCLSFDHFIEEIHRLYGLEVPKDHLNKDSWLRKLIEESILAQHGRGALGNMGAATPSSGRGELAHGAVKVWADVAVPLLELFQSSLRDLRSDDGVGAAQWVDGHGATHGALDLVCFAGKRFSKHMLDIRRLGKAIGFNDISRNVFGQSADASGDVFIDYYFIGYHWLRLLSHIS